MTWSTCSRASGGTRDDRYADPLLPPGEPGPPDLVLVVSPARGLFCPLGDQIVTVENEVVEQGAAIGMVADQEVRAFRSGLFVDMLVAAGDRVKPGQPLAVLRAK
jgi:multidrug efflux pump subunit AcrA (membrane-fusion protein)